MIPIQVLTLAYTTGYHSPWGNFSAVAMPHRAPPIPHRSQKKRRIIARRQNRY